MPLLAMGGEYFGAAFLVDHCKLVAENVKGSNIKVRSLDCTGKHRTGKKRPVGFLYSK